MLTREEFVLRMERLIEQCQVPPIRDALIAGYLSTLFLPYPVIILPNHRLPSLHLCFTLALFRLH